MFDDLSTQEWFFLALAAGTGFLVVRHFMDKLSDGAGKGAGPRQAAPAPPSRDGADQNTWFRGDAQPADGAGDQGFARGGERGGGGGGGGGGAHVPPRDTPAAPWYQVLEVSPTAPAGDIKAAYKRKIRKYHPDKVAGLGPEFIAIAEAKAQEINQAYQQACADRSITDLPP